MLHLGNSLQLSSYSSSSKARPQRSGACCCSSTSRSSNGRQRSGKQGISNQKQRGQQQQPQQNYGFGALATLLQQQRAMEEAQAARGERLTKTVASTSGGLSEREKRAVITETNSFAKVFSAQTKEASKVVDEKKKKSKPLVKTRAEGVSESTSSGFAEAVFAAMQQSALERQQQKLKRRNEVRKGGRTPANDVMQEKKSEREMDGRPLVIKSEWTGRIEDLEKKLDDLKQQYYNRF